MPVLSRPFSPVQPEQLQGTSTYAEALQAAIGETWATGPTQGLITAGDIEEAEYGAQQQASDVFMATRGGMPRTIQPPKLSPRIPLADAEQKIKDAGLEGHIPLNKYPNGIRSETLNLLIQLNQEKVKRQTISSQYDGWSPDIAGMVVGSLIDPTNVALSFVPVVGEARYAKLLAQAGESALARSGVRAGVGAIEGTAGAVLAEPLIYGGQQEWRNDYDAYDSLLNIAGGATFGSLLHAGAGLARDSFGNPIVEALPQSRKVFADPDVVTAEQFQRRARDMGVSESVAQALTPKAVRDSVTGYFDGRADAIKLDTLQRAQAHVKATGEPAYYVSGDIANLGGLNAHVGNVAEAANVHYRALAEILDGEVRKTGGDVVPLRTGGDEISLVVVNADAQAMEMALNAVDSRISEYVRANGLADIANPKGGARGIGLHSGVAVISPDMPAASIFARADAGVDASKKGLKYVNRKPTGTPGADAPEGQARRAGEGITAPDERLRPAGYATGARGALAAADIIDQRLAELDARARGQLSESEFKALQKEDADLVAALRENEKALSMVTADPTARLSDADLDFITQRRGDIRQSLEASRAAKGYEQELERLQARLAKIDRDADLIALSERLAPSVPDPYAPIREFVASLDQATQAAALRMAVAQAIDGRPVDVTPTMLTDPQFHSNEAAYRDAITGAQRNATQTDGANETASRVADEVPAQTKSMLEDAKERLADEMQELRDQGGDPASLDADAEDLKLTQTAVKAASLCMMRSNG